MDFYNDFIKKFYIEPMFNYEGYNFVNTLTYGIILFACVYLIYKLFRKLKIEINTDAVLSWTSLILFGASLRVLEDQGTFNRTDFLGFLTISPGIWFVIGGVGIGLAFISHLLYKKTKLFKSKKQAYYFLFIMGLVISAPILFMIQFKNIQGILSVFGLTAFTMLFYLIAGKFFNLKFLKSKTNLLLIFGQILDGCATFVSVDYYNYSEQHVFGSGLIGLTGSAFWLMVVKAVYITVLLYFLDKWFKEKNSLNMIKIVLLTLGMGPGLRDVLRLGAMV
ncbi:MAG: DUF63 family protein [Candidatus Nanoarchaeia archaeon]|nr:DUF63 family protein [Candidatus Nanoarchaeia archaeon]